MGIGPFGYKSPWIRALVSQAEEYECNIEIDTVDEQKSTHFHIASSDISKIGKTRRTTKDKGDHVELDLSQELAWHEDKNTVPSIFEIDRSAEIKIFSVIIHHQENEPRYDENQDTFLVLPDDKFDDEEVIRESSGRLDFRINAEGGYGPPFDEPKYVDNWDIFFS